MSLTSLLSSASGCCSQAPTSLFIKTDRYFDEPPGGIERWNRTQGFGIEDGAREKEISAALDDYLDKLGRADRELALALLSRIFPSVKKYDREKSKGLGSLTISESSEERKNPNPNFFPRYFEYAVPATMFGGTRNGQLYRFYPRG